MVINGVDLEEKMLAAFCSKHSITKMSLFGSILTDRFGPESDVDFLVEFDPNRRVSLFDIGGMVTELTELLGRDADLRTYGDLSVYFRDDVVRSARVVYAAA
jgi:predicted nucleotidyltransferase